MQIRMKLAVIGVLMILMAIPLLLLVSKIYERNSYEEQARRDIAASWTGVQKLVGPILIVPYIRTYPTRNFDKALQQYVDGEEEVSEQLYLLPETLQADVDLKTELRYRGIYEIPVYASNVSLSGTFSTEKIVALAKRSDTKGVQIPRLIVLVSDMRGIADLPQLTWGDDSDYSFRPGSKMDADDSGIHAELGSINTDAASDVSFAVDLQLRGMSSFRFAPIGESASLRVQSNWPHPSFDGLYLPSEREISADGFVANWQTSVFSTNSTQQAERCATGDCAELLNNTLGISLLDPVDVYLQAQRATKYGILFIGLTFTVFFLFEVLKQLAIHPIQYGLVGLALSIFYLLLVSLAEHLAFGWAYLIATLACCGLLGFYVSYILHSSSRGVTFAAAITALYGVLYIIIEAEDYAFSMGAVLVFATLAAIMFATRNIDWYALSRGPLSGNDADESGQLNLR